MIKLNLTSNEFIAILNELAKMITLTSIAEKQGENHGND